MKFEEALVELKAGKTVTRADWDGKFQVSLMHGNDLAFTDNHASTISHGWMAGATEMLADDWRVVAEENPAPLDFDKIHPAA